MPDRLGSGATTVNLLRNFELRSDGQRVSLPPGTQRLIAFLALRGGVLQRGYVAGTLWLEYSQDAANANLRTAIWRLRRLPCPVLAGTTTDLALAPGVAVDLHRTAATIRGVSANGGYCADDELDDIMLAGELLPDWYDDWVVIERERFRQARMHSLEALCSALAHEGRYDQAIQVGLAAVADEPLRESAHRAVMHAHLAEGNRSEALRQYELCRRSLSPLGLEPTVETDRLRQRCATGDGVVTTTV
jgi:DNA-binding SARP family transcriptional activator